MDKTFIKKCLYKQKPFATFVMVRKEIAYYNALIRVNDDVLLPDTFINFEIPVNDMGDADLLPQMDAKLLIRWLIV